MSSYNLKYLLTPGSVAVVGASDRSGSVGATVMRDLSSAGFSGPVWTVNLRHESVVGERAYRGAAQLPAVPDGTRRLTAVGSHHLGE